HTVDEPGIKTIQLDVANSLTWAKSPFDIPVEEALKNQVEQSVPGMTGGTIPCFRPIYQFLFTVLHLFGEACLQKFVDVGTDVGRVKCGDVIRLIERDHQELTDGRLRQIMETHGVTHAVAWVLRHTDETFHTRTLELLALEKHGDEQLLVNQMHARGY